MFVSNLVTASVTLTDADHSHRWSGSGEIVKVADEMVEVNLVENVCVKGRVLLNGRPLMGVDVSAYDSSTTFRYASLQLAA